MSAGDPDAPNGGQEVVKKPLAPQSHVVEHQLESGSDTSIGEHPDDRSLREFQNNQGNQEALRAARGELGTDAQDLVRTGPQSDLDFTPPEQSDGVFDAWLEDGSFEECPIDDDHPDAYHTYDRTQYIEVGGPSPKKDRPKEAEPERVTEPNVWWFDPADPSWQEPEKGRRHVNYADSRDSENARLWGTWADGDEWKKTGTQLAATGQAAYESVYGQAVLHQMTGGLVGEANPMDLYDANVKTAEMGLDLAYKGLSTPIRHPIQDHAEMYDPATTDERIQQMGRDQGKQHYDAQIAIAGELAGMGMGHALVAGASGYRAWKAGKLVGGSVADTAEAAIRADIHKHLPAEYADELAYGTDMSVVDEKTFREMTGGKGPACIVPKDGAFEVVFQEGQVGRAAAEEARHLLDAFADPKRGDTIREIYDAVPDRETWRNTPRPKKKDLKLQQLQVEIDTHLDMVRNAESPDLAMEDALDNLIRQQDELEGTDVADLDSLSWWKEDEPPWLRQKRKKDYAPEQWDQHLAVQRKYRTLIDETAVDADPIARSEALGRGWEAAPDDVPADVALRRMRYVEDQAALGHPEMEFETWVKRAEQGPKNSRVGREIEDATLGELGIQNNNYRTSYTVAKGPRKGRPMRPEEVTSREVGGEIKHFLEDGTPVEFDSSREISRFKAPDEISEPPAGLTPEERLMDPRHDPKVRNLAGRELHTRPDGISETHVVDIKHVAAGGKLYDSDQLRLQRLMAYDHGKRQAIVMRTEPGTPVASFPEPSGPLAEKSGEVFLRGDDGFYQWMVNDETGKAGWVAAPPGHVASTLGGSL